MNLEQKFSTLETQLSTQHSDMMNALNALLAALGAPPPSPGATLADVVGALNQLALMVAGLRTDMATQHAAHLLQLQAANTTLNLMNENASLNAQRMLAALAWLDPCRQCDAGGPLELPPADVTPVTVDTVHCQRMQALIHYLLRFTVKLDVMSSVGINFSPTVIRDAYREVMDEIEIGDAPQPSLSELAEQVRVGIIYIASSVFEVNSLPRSFMDISDGLLQPLYNATNAADGLAAYKAYINNSSLPDAMKGVFNAMAYVSIFNYFYDKAKPLSLAGFDGSICAPASTDCVQLESQGVAFSAASPWFAVALTGQLGINGENHDNRGNTADQPIWFKPPAACYVTLLSGSATLYSGGSQALIVGTPVALIAGGEASGHPYSVGSQAGNFVVELCPGQLPS